MYFKKIFTLSIISFLGWSSMAQVPVLVKDLNTQGNGSPQRLTNVDGTLYFVANNGTNGNELWKSDGTEAGTAMVKDINPGSSNASIVKITSYKGKAFFRANSISGGYELYRSDGTDAGTQVLKEFGAGNASIDPSELVVFKNELYFTERSIAGGVNLWKSDGTEAGTVMLRNLYPSGNASNAAYFAVLNNQLFFMASENALFSTDIWKTDGTANGTSILITMGGQTGALYTVGNKLLFAFAGEGGAGTGKGLYVSDGMVNGTFRIKELDLLNIVNFPTNGTAMVFKNELIFTANDGTNGEELWKSDGTEQGTVLLKDIKAGSESGLDVQPFLTYINEQHFYFVANDGTSNRELWVSDGSTTGTSVLDTPGKGSVNPLGMYAYKGFLYYRARAVDNLSGEELWRSDGTRAGTKLLVDFWSGFNSSSPANFCGINNKLFFSASNGTVGTELYSLSVDASSAVFNSNKKELRVYPNPSTGLIHVMSMEQGAWSRVQGVGSGALQFELFDLYGKRVLSGALIDGRVDVSGLDAGMYILKVGEEGYAKLRICELAN
jgi:ELWxxDGT repeat protein